MNIENAIDPVGTEFAFLTTSTTRASTDTSTLGTAADDVTEPRTFAFALTEHQQLTSGSSNNSMPIHISLSDQNGNGVLVATDKLFVVGGNVGALTAGSYVAKILYRLVNVGITEYVGIVQSQQ